MINKLAIGTVQFGLDYGINNTSGQVPEEEVTAILNLAKMVGIDTIDTAHAYGKSETVLGNTNLLGGFKVISKLPPTRKGQVNILFQESLNRLGCSSVYGYMLHNFSIYQKDKSIWQELVKLKNGKRVQKIGVSLYSVAELKELWADGVELDLVQVPYNIFDRRFEEVFPELKKKGIEIHTRSTFLQGLFFKSLMDLPNHFEPVRKKLEVIRLYCRANNQSIADLCLGFVISNEYVNHVVIGGDKTGHLAENIKVVKSSVSVDFSDLDNLRTDNLNIINPSLWKI